MGPVASQVAIKLLGTNGGGFFAANSAHPYENPTAVTNLIEAFLILLVPAALPFVFGRMSGAMRQGWAIYAVMLTIYAAAFGALYTAELAGNPLMNDLGVSGISMEERRSGSAPWARRSLPHQQQRHPAARSTPCTTRSRRSGA